MLCASSNTINCWLYLTTYIYIYIYIGEKHRCQKKNKKARGMIFMFSHVSADPSCWQAQRSLQIVCNDGQIHNFHGTRTLSGDTDHQTSHWPYLSTVRWCPNIYYWDLRQFWKPTVKPYAGAYLEASMRSTNLQWSGKNLFPRETIRRVGM